MSPEDLQNHIAALNDHYSKLKEYNLSLKVKHFHTQAREKRLIGEFQKENIQSETSNMVVKY
jgi:hypothetical protein